MCVCNVQPTGLLTYLDSTDDVPDDDIDRINVRDNLKLAQVTTTTTTTANTTTTTAATTTTTTTATAAAAAAANTT